MAESLDYKKAGLDLEKYAETMAGIAPLLTRTWDRTRVIRPPFKGAGGKGGAFASLFDPDPSRGLFRRKYKHPVIVTCTDGVGSKLKIASLMNRYDTVGIDLVAMSVNDLICTGGEPLVFLDYVAMHKDDPELHEETHSGHQRRLPRIGLCPGRRRDGHPARLLPARRLRHGRVLPRASSNGTASSSGEHIEVGDTIVGVASSGVHSNGYSLVRKIVFDVGEIERERSRARTRQNRRRGTAHADAALRPAGPQTREPLPRQETASSAASRTSPAAACPTTSAGSCRRAAGP